MTFDCYLPSRSEVPFSTGCGTNLRWRRIPTFPRRSLGALFTLSPSSIPVAIIGRKWVVPKTVSLGCVNRRYGLASCGVHGNGYRFQVRGANAIADSAQVVNHVSDGDNAARLLVRPTMDFDSASPADRKPAIPFPIPKGHPKPTGAKFWRVVGYGSGFVYFGPESVFDISHDVHTSTSNGRGGGDYYHIRCW